MQNLIMLNGKRVPQPKRGLSLFYRSNTTDEENANGNMVWQVKGNDRFGVEPLEWEFLRAGEWQDILAEVADGRETAVTMPDARGRTWVTRIMKPVSASAQPWHLDPETGLPLSFRNCIVELSDTGVDAR